MMISNTNQGVFFLLVLIGLSGCNGSPNYSTIITSDAAANSKVGEPKTLVVALLPDQSNSTLIKNNQALKTYLEKKLNTKIDLFLSNDYSSMIEAEIRGRLDLAYFGPLSYVMAKTKSNIEPFAALKRHGSTTTQSVVIANVAEHINSVADIAGKTMAYGDPASTTSHLIPKSMLVEQGLKAKKDYQEVFLGSQDAVALAVQNRNAQAGGLKKSNFESLLQKKKIDPVKVKVLAESEPFPEYPWTMRSDLSPELKAKIRSAFLELKDQDVLKPFKAEGFGSVEDKDYDQVRKLAPLLNLDLAKPNK